MSSSISNSDPSSAEGRSDTRARTGLVLIATLIVFFELASAALLPVDLGRHEVDRLAARLDRDPNVDVLVFSDSVSYGVLPDLPVGWVDGCSNSALGIAGNYYLLRRVIASGGSPRHVVLIEHPESLAYDLDSVHTETYFTSVVDRPEEIADLARRLGRTDLVHPMQANALKRAGSPPSNWRAGGVRRALHEFLVGLRDRVRPASMTVPEQTTSRAATAIAALATREPLVVSNQARQYHYALSELATAEGFTLHLVAAPLPPTIRRSWTEIMDVQLAFFTSLAVENPLVQVHPAPWIAPEDRLFRDSMHLHIGARPQYGNALREFLSRITD